MTLAPAIAAMSHLALRVRGLDAALDNSTQVMGLHVVGRDSGWTYLTCNSAHHVLQYTADDVDAVDHIALAAAGPAGLAAVRDRVKAAGLEMVSDRPLELGFSDALAFIGADGFCYEVGIGMPSRERPDAAMGARPTHFGHVNLHVPDVQEAVAFAREILDFRVSDVVEGRGVFLRCNSEHHAIAYLQGRGVLHHHAWAVPSIADLSRLGDVLDDREGTLLWGPLRHGAGNNIAAYFAEPCGAVVEVYAEMEAILDEDAFKERTWSNEDPRWWSRWTKVRADGFHEYGLPPAKRHPDPPREPSLPTIRR